MEKIVELDASTAYTLSPMGDRALVIGLKDEGHAALWKIAAELALRLRALEAPWMLDAIPAYDTVTVVYDPLLAVDAAALSGAAAVLPYEAVRAHVQALLDIPLRLASPPASRMVEIPVCYGGEYGPDLADCAARSGLDAGAFAALHAGGDYQVAMIGFMPGFPYLTGLPESLAQPRRPSPRSRVPAGSVGIAGGQTGIYPLASPGGWQLIGRTPLRLFDHRRPEPSLLRAGDTMRFVPISEEAMRQREET